MRVEAERLLILELTAPVRGIANGTGEDAPLSGSDAALVWTTGDSEVLVEPAKTRLALRPGLILVELRLATDQTGPGTLLLAFSIGSQADNAQLLAVVEDIPRGTPSLVSRWGELTQDIIWSALHSAILGSWRRRFPQRSLHLVGLYTDGHTLSGVFAKPVSLDEILEYLRDPDANDRPVFDSTPSEIGGPGGEVKPGCMPGFLSALFKRSSISSEGGGS